MLCRVSALMDDGSATIWGTGTALMRGNLGLFRYLLLRRAIQRSPVQSFPERIPGGVADSGFSVFKASQFAC